MAAQTSKPPTDAHELFAVKWARVRRLVSFRCRHRCVQPTDREDVLQLAAFYLWKQCVRSVDPSVRPFEIDAMRIAVAAWGRWRRIDQQHRARGKGTDPDTVDLNPILNFPAKQTEVRVPAGGTTVTLSAADAEMDAPQACRRWIEGIGSAALARRLGVSKQAVSASPRAYGGIYFPGAKRWLFAPDARRPIRRRRSGTDHAPARS